MMALSLSNIPCLEADTDLSAMAARDSPIKGDEAHRFYQLTNHIISAAQYSKMVAQRLKSTCRSVVYAARSIVAL